MWEWRGRLSRPASSSRSPATEQFRLEPLGPQHNDSDYEAWSSSVEHVHMTPGWETSS